jgi:hypothetical protein
MPLRRFEGKGDVYLPAYLFSWLMTRRARSSVFASASAASASLRFRSKRSGSPARVPTSRSYRFCFRPDRAPS